MAVDPQRIKQRLTALKGLRSPHEQVWRDCFEYSSPHLGVGWMTATPTAGDIQAQRARLLSGVAGESLNTSADGFIGGMVPANSLWFGLDAGRETDEEKSWLADAAMTIWENLNASNFAAEAYDSALSLLAAGWFALYVDEDDGGGYYTENWPLSQCYISSSRQGGKVDTIYREFPLSVGAMIAEYGRDHVSEGVRQLADAGKVDEMRTVLWIIEPRADYLPGAKIASRLPFASCHIEADTNHTLREGGYHEFPVIVPRWRRIPGSAYGVGPMTDALPDARTVNEVARWELAAAETVIAPPLKVVDDGVINTRGIRLGPRKVIVCNDINNIAPLITGAKVEFGQWKVERRVAKVGRALMADLFDKIINDPAMTATQVHAIMGLIRQRMGPRFGRLQSEWLQPLIERCYGLALRAGILGMPPQSLRNRTYSIKYESPLARAQKLEDVSAMDRYEQALGAEAAAKPDILDVYDWDAGARKRAELLGVPQDLIPSQRAVKELREQRAQAHADAQQANAQQQVQLAAQTKGAEALAGQLAAA